MAGSVSLSKRKLQRETMVEEEEEEEKGFCLLLLTRSGGGRDIFGGE